jgi:hypothetical protein
MNDNELIAEFMGQHVTPIGLRREVMQQSYYAHELQYHQSWDWLMPVVEKIDDIEEYLYVIINKKTCVVQYVTKTHTKDRKIDAVYAAVVEFIKWYNQQKS